MSAAAQVPAYVQAELAIQERLRAASKLGVLGYTLRAVESLPIDVDDRLKHYVNDFPAAWTVFGGWSVRSDRSGGGAVIEARYSVVCAAQNLRSEQAARHGTAGAVGSYQMVADVVGLLLGNDLGLDVGPLVLGQCQNLYTGQLQHELKVSLFAVSFTSTMTLDAAPADVLDNQPLADFADFHVGWIAPDASPDILASETHQTLETA